MSCGPAGFDCCRSGGVTVASGLSQSSRVSKVRFCSHLFFIVAEFRGRYQDSLSEEYTTCPCNFVQWFLSCPVLCVTCVSHLHHCRLEAAIYILMEAVPEFIVPVYYVLKSLFLLQGGDGVCELDRHTDTRVTPLFNWAYKYVLFRTVNKEAGHLYCMRCFTLVYFDDQNIEKLPLSYSLRAEEGTMSC